MDGLVEEDAGSVDDPARSTAFPRNVVRKDAGSNGIHEESGGGRGPYRIRPHLPSINGALHDPAAMATHECVESHQSCSPPALSPAAAPAQPCRRSASTSNSRLASGVPSSRTSATPSHASTAASRTVYNNRFIPSRTGSDLAPSPSSHDAAASGPTASSGSAPAMSPYCALLRSALFGPDTPDRVASSATVWSSSSSPGAASAVGTPSTGNIFRFKAEVPATLGGHCFPARTRRTCCSQAFSRPGAPAQGRSQGLPTRCWMRPLCRMTSTSTSSIGLHTMSLLSGWATVFTCVMHAAARSPSYVIWGVCAARYSPICRHKSRKSSDMDATRSKRIRIMESHRVRVGVLAWSLSLLSSGSRDKRILHHDIRAQEDYVSKLIGHKSEVCGLKWSYNNRQQQFLIRKSLPKCSGITEDDWSFGLK